MSLYQKLIDYITEKGLSKCDYAMLGVLLNEFAYTECYHMLSEIYEVICDTTLPDAACYYKIERIMESFNRRQLDTGARHMEYRNPDGTYSIEKIFHLNEEKNKGAD